MGCYHRCPELQSMRSVRQHQAPLTGFQSVVPLHSSQPCDCPSAFPCSCVSDPFSVHMFTRQSPLFCFHTTVCHNITDANSCFLKPVFCFVIITFIIIFVVILDRLPKEFSFHLGLLEIPEGKQTEFGEHCSYSTQDEFLISIKLFLC